MTTLIISEKPSTAKKIAEALADGKPKKMGKRGSYWFEFRGKERDIKVVPAVGHLFVLTQSVSSSQWTYPVFDTKWIPVFEAQKNSAYAKSYYKNIKDLAREAKEFYVATDFDIEGEVISFNILRFLCGVKDAHRMKFSTLTKGELEESFEKASGHLYFPMLEAGLTRHQLDWIFGINLSRALTLALKVAGGYKTLSTGRVQGPTLKILEERENEIKKFVPEPFWDLQLLGFVNGQEIIAIHEKGKIFDKQEAERLFNLCKDGKPVVEKVEKTEYEQLPPTPFDLTTLQRESYANFGYSPKQTMDISQSLYEMALISYPRTSSQKLPFKLGFKKILERLSKQGDYVNLCEKLLRKPKLIPRQGKKEDPAHPAIFPTGNLPKALNTRQKNIYDIITRRFLSVFADPALREQVEVTIDVKGEKFKTSGARTVQKNWMEFYGKYARFKEKALPEMKAGDSVEESKIDLLEKETSPPKRYSQASILKVMEELGLGTKGTRALVLQTLYDRNYIEGRSIVVTQLGSVVTGSLKKYCPEIISEELTRKFEEEMELIQEGKKSREHTINEARGGLTKILEKFKENEKNIGSELYRGVKEFEKTKDIIGKCKCGGDLKITYSKTTRKRFIGCSGYPKCSESYPLPQKGNLRVLPETCNKCGLHFVLISSYKRKPWKLCVKCGFEKNKLKK